MEFTVHAPLIAEAARAGQFVRVLPSADGELIPLTLADWDAEAGTIGLVVQAMGTSSIEINQMAVGEAFAGIAGPLGQPSELHRYADDQTVVFTAGGLGLPPVYPIMREHLRLGNHVTLIAGFRSADLLFWTGDDERVGGLQREFGDQLDVVYTTQRRHLRRRRASSPARWRRCSRQPPRRGARRSPRWSRSARR